MIETNFKHTDIGLIPHDWEVKTILSVIDECNYGVGAEAIKYNGGAKYLRITDIDDGSHHYSPKPLTSPAFYDECHLAKSGDMFVARTGASVGKSYLYHPQDGKLVYAGFLIKVHISKANPYYVFLNTLTQRYSNWVISESARTGQPGLNAEQLKTLLIPLPPTLAEQERIAGALSSIDTLIGALNEQIEKKRHIRQGTMQQLLTGKKRLAGFTGEWRDKKLDEMGFLTAGGTPSTIEPSYWGGDINWLQSGAVQNCIITSDAVVKTISKEGLQNSATYLIKPDSVLIAITGATCANVGYLTFESAANQSVVSIEPNKENCAMFLFQKLLTERTNILSNKGGSAQSGVTLKALKQLTITIPPTIAEQRAIAAVLSGMDTEIAALEQKRNKYIAIKQGMMQNLLTGKIRLI